MKHSLSRQCIEENPGRQAVRFAGVFISLTRIAVSTNMSVSSLSRIFSGERQPSLTSARKIAAAMGLNVQELIDGLEIKNGEYRATQSRANESEAVA